MAENIVCYGDSITAANEPYEYVQLLRNAHPDWEITDRGVSGATSESVTQDIENTVHTYTPSIVTVMMGVNDANVNGLNHWKGPLYSPYLAAEYYDRITRAVNAIRTTHPSARIIIITPTPFTDGYWDHHDQLTSSNHFLGYLEQYNAQIQQWGTDHPGEAEVCDVYTPIMEDWLTYSANHEPDWTNINYYMLADNLHPNEHGHGIIYAKLVQAIGEEPPPPPPPPPPTYVKRLGVFFGWDPHPVVKNADQFMAAAFSDNPWVMSDALIWFSTLWHFDPNGQNGLGAVEAILQRTDQTDKRIWLALCFDFSDDAQWTRYGELIDQIKHHPSLYAVGICTDEWSQYPATETEAKEKFLQFRDLVRSKEKKAFAHLFFGWSGSQGPIPDGNAWFCREYDLVIFHNNYPHYDTSGQSNLSVLSSMLNRNYAPGCVGGSQGYFGATGGIYRNGTPTVSDYWLTSDFENVIDSFETAREDHAQVLFVAMQYPGDQWVERAALFPKMEQYGDWYIEGTEPPPPPPDGKTDWGRIGSIIAATLTAIGAAYAVYTH